MPAVKLYSHQVAALERMKNGCILNGSVGSGKSLTGLCYYYRVCGGNIGVGKFVPMKHPIDLYIITTAQKRDNLEWEKDLIKVYMTTKTDSELYKFYNVKVIVDSWNNIQKYTQVKNSFFMFDEQRLISNGAWVKAFYKIAKENQWILLSATPGDTWLDYVPVFVANGFYRNLTDFKQQHIIYKPFLNWPVIDRYINEGKLMRLRRTILINMNFERHTVPHHEYIQCDYDRVMYDSISKNRWNVFTNEPIKNASEYCQCLRRVINSDPSRQNAVIDIIKEHPRVIIFYSYDYELEILRNLFQDKYPYTEWNGHKHQPLLDGPKWVYLSQYKAGSEGWNCITCDTIIFYSQDYSYRTMVQASGRIDRLTTPYTDLYYYHLTSSSKIDKAIYNAVSKKKKFNEKGFAPIFEEIKL